MSDDPSSSFPTWPTVPTTAYVACTAPWKQYKDHCYFVQGLTVGSDGLWLAWTFDDASVLIVVEESDYTLFPDNTTAWTDGTPVDYHKGLYPGPEKYVFGMLHDESCEIDWEGWGTMAISARYICKKGLDWLH
ncbi:unnamed protein product, partial [Mesorhabditis spiculigera]